MTIPTLAAIQAARDAPVTQPVRDWSYGLIPLRRLPAAAPPAPPPPLSSATTQLLLICQKPALPGYPPTWSFPKGHPEPRDAGDVLATALREVAEETGLAVRRGDVLAVVRAAAAAADDDDRRPAHPDTNEDVASGGFQERYWVPIRGCVKEVTLFVGEVDAAASEQLALDAGEIAAARWCSWDEAGELMAWSVRKSALLDSVRRALDEGRLQRREA